MVRSSERRNSSKGGMIVAKEVDPLETTRARAFELWMNAPNPMVTFFKTLDVTNLIRISKRKRLKFNMLLDYCIGKAASWEAENDRKVFIQNENCDIGARSDRNNICLCSSKSRT